MSMKVFVSYKWEDPSHNAWVERLGRDLRAHGIDALLDKWEVRYGESFSDYMTRGIHSSDAVLFVMTPEFIAAAEAVAGVAGAVKFELQLALARRLAGERFRLIGILRSGDRSVQQLRDMKYADFREDALYKESLVGLVADLTGALAKPPLAFDASGGMPTAEWCSVGEELGVGGLHGEFLLETHDLIVWRESTEGPSSPIALFCAGDESYASHPIEPVAYATRIRAAPHGCFLAIQEREGIRIFDQRTMRQSRFLPISLIGDPIIRSEAQHPSSPLVAIGTDYGRVVVWNWMEDRIVFTRHHFPAGKVNWISGVAFSGPGDIVLFCVDNVLIQLRTESGEIVSEKALGPAEEISAIAVNGQNGVVAVGSVMDTKVYKSADDPSLLYQVHNSGPLVQDLRFSADGAWLGIVDGGTLGGGGVAVVEAISGASTHRFAEWWPVRGKTGVSDVFRGDRSVSFSSSGQLAAVGQGGRVGLYKRPKAGGR